MLTGEQIRGARAMLRMEQAELAKAAGISTPTIIRLEGMKGTVSANMRTVQAIKSALVAAGVEFIDQNGGGPGVRLAKP